MRPSSERDDAVRPQAGIAAARLVAPHPVEAMGDFVELILQWLSPGGCGGGRFALGAFALRNLRSENLRSSGSSPALRDRGLQPFADRKAGTACSPRRCPRSGPTALMLRAWLLIGAHRERRCRIRGVA